MFHWSDYETIQHEDPGQFICPECGVLSNYDVVRTYRHFRFYLMIFPIVQSKELYDEAVRCTTCGANLPVTVLAVGAPTIGSMLEVEAYAHSGIHCNLGNVVALSDAAAQEILRRHFSGEFESKPVVRIAPPRLPEEGYAVGFDFALADGRDWIGESHGIGILVDRRDAPRLLGQIVDFRNGIFCEGGIATRPAR
jgi:Fe-S cluster assembly iron-binding protein IscA